MFDLSKIRRARRTAVCFAVALLAVSIAEAGPLTRSELGELFLFGVPDSTLSVPVVRHLAQTCPGSILLFRRNLVSNRQALTLVQDLRTQHRKCSAQPLLIGLDQEGGQVARIPFDPPMPSPWALGAAKDPHLAEELGFQVGMTLRKLGVNMNLAPVLDLGDEHKKSFIGSRSFGADPALVGETGAAFSFGLVRAHVLPVAKHFPGLGSMNNDPHLSMIRRSGTQNSILEKDLVPFREFTQIFPTGIMPSHLIYPQIDTNAGPGTFSKNLLQGWLRDRLNYHGLVISDDLLMKGAQENSDVGDNVVAALGAGVDLVMVSWSLKSQARAVAAVQQALTDGRLSETSLREKIERVRKVKHVLGEPTIAPKSAANSQLLLMGSHRYSDLAYEVLRRNVAAQSGHLYNGNPRRLFLWPADLRLKWQIERVLHSPVTLGLPKNLRLQNGDLILAFVRSRREANQLSAWNSTLKKKTVAVNQLEPGILRGEFLSEAQLFLEHPMLGAEVAKRLVHAPMMSSLIQDH